MRVGASNQSIGSIVLSAERVRRRRRAAKAMKALDQPNTGSSMRHTRTSRRSAKLSQQLRNEAGRWLRELRERRGLSQRDLAKRVGADNHTFISQLEHGRCRIPQRRYLAWAHALGVEPRKFVRALLSYYDPMTYDIIFAVKKRHAPLKVTTRSRDQHDAVQDLRPDSVEPHALEPIGGPESTPASARSSHNAHLISQGDQF